MTSALFRSLPVFAAVALFFAASTPPRPPYLLSQQRLNGPEWQKRLDLVEVPAEDPDAGPQRLLCVDFREYEAVETTLSRGSDEVPVDLDLELAAKVNDEIRLLYEKNQTKENPPLRMLILLPEPPPIPSVWSRYRRSTG